MNVNFVYFWLKFKFYYFACILILHAFYLRLLGTLSNTHQKTWSKPPRRPPILMTRWRWSSTPGSWEESPKKWWRKRKSCAKKENFNPRAKNWHKFEECDIKMTNRISGLRFAVDQTPQKSHFRREVCVCPGQNGEALVTNLSFIITT